MFNDNQLEEGVGLSMDLGVRIQYVFPIMHAMLRLFKTLTNFTLVEFDKLPTLMVPIIISHARFIVGHHNLTSNQNFDFKCLNMGFWIKESN
jgi:hypothetical protein